MSNWLLQRKIRQLERDGNDDLLLILEVGPRDYSTFELNQLLKRLQYQHHRAQYYQQRLFIIGASISFWVGAAFLSAALGYYALGYLFLAFVPAALLLVICGHLYLRYQYRTHRDAQLINAIIHQELERRRKDASIF